MDKHPVFKDYELADYVFVVVNKTTLTPLKWIFYATKEYGTLAYGKHLDIKMRDPFDIAKELTGYLEDKPDVPVGINQTKYNNIIDWINNKI